MPSFIKGDKEIINLLKKIDKKDARKCVKTGAKAGCKILLAAAQAAVPVHTGAARASLKVRAAPKQRTRFGYMVVTGEGWFKGPTFYFAFMDLGHKIGKRTTQSKDAAVREMHGVDKRTHIEGQFTLLRSAKRTEDQAMTEMINVLKRELDKVFSQK